jgi:hypothetical protein
LSKIPKVEIDRLREAIVNELSNENTAKDDTTTTADDETTIAGDKTTTADDETTVKKAKVTTGRIKTRFRLLNTVFAIPRLRLVEVSLIPDYLVISFKTCILKHRVAILVPVGYSETVKAKCLSRRTELYEKFNRK